MTLGDRIAELRNDKGYKQRELAEALNTTVSSISNYEKGVNAPDLERLAKIADLFDTSTDFLLGRTNIRFQFSKIQNEDIGGLSLNEFNRQILSLDKAHQKLLTRMLSLIALENDVHKRK